MIFPFCFQLGNKPAGCEDAPPAATASYTVVCDGLGGSGATKHPVHEEGADEPVLRTSGYLGSRVVCDCVERFYAENYERIRDAVVQPDQGMIGKLLIVNELKGVIVKALNDQMTALQIDPMLTKKKALKVFPTTLASSLYFPAEGKLIMLTIWAGDSRVYILSPSKGLQLLSEDDAIDAGESMNSASEMTNCISAGNQFKLNFVVHEVSEPCVIFACSDGCFDYQLSPLHFEWLLLQPVLTRLPEAQAAALSEAFSTSIKECMYQTIGDDTTMAGIILEMDSSQTMKALYQPRMSAFGDHALEMNEAIKGLKAAQSKRDSAQKKCRLYDERVRDELRSAAIRALKTKSPARLYEFICALPCYSNYRLLENQADAEVNSDFAQTLLAATEKRDQFKRECTEMMISDLLRFEQARQEPQNTLFFSSFIPSRERLEPPEECRPESAIQPLKTFVQVVRHPEFSRIVSLPEAAETGVEQYLNLQVQQLEALLSVLENHNLLFRDLWEQAYYSTSEFAFRRKQIAEDAAFNSDVSRVLEHSARLSYLSSLTEQTITQYRRACEEMQSVQNDFNEKRRRRMENLPEDFCSANGNSIFDAMIQLEGDQLKALLAGTRVSLDKALSFAEAKKAAGKVDEEVEQAQAKVDQIWNQYKSSYQLFEHAAEKGVC